MDRANKAAGQGRLWWKNQFQAVEKRWKTVGAALEIINTRLITIGRLARHLWKIADRLVEFRVTGVGKMRPQWLME